MGCGSWSPTAYTVYTASVGRTVTSDGVVDGEYTAQEMYTQKHISDELNPYNVTRECCDTEEHPNTMPVILALDVTGSMGDTAVEVAKRLNVIMTELYEKVQDVEFCIMGIGDLAYDSAPIQMSQFESDIRIAEHLDKIYFEGGGGGNDYESYTAAWYMGVRHTKLDCWDRGQKGIIITMGDEPLNPYLPKGALSRAIGDDLQADIETSELYDEVSAKYDIYHLAISDTSSYRWHKPKINSTWNEFLDGDHFKTVSLDALASTIVDIIANNAGSKNETVVNDNGEISW